MKGEVLSTGADGGGLISGDDGQRYSFQASAARGAVRTGARVDFLGLNGVANDVVVLADTDPRAAPYAAGQVADSASPAYAGVAQSGAPYDFVWSMFSFNGRLRRSHFWINWGILLAVGVLLGWIPLLGFLITLGLIWPNVAITVKRLHDMGRTGWLTAAPIAANVVLMIVAIMSVGFGAIMNAEALEREDPSAILALMGPMLGLLLLTFVINIGWLLWIGITDSQPGRNRFGPNPKYPAQDDASVFS